MDAYQHNMQANTVVRQLALNRNTNLYLMPLLLVCCFNFRNK